LLTECVDVWRQNLQANVKQITACFVNMQLPGDTDHGKPAKSAEIQQEWKPNLRGFRGENGNKCCGTPTGMEEITQNSYGNEDAFYYNAASAGKRIYVKFTAHQQFQIPRVSNRFQLLTVVCY